MFFALQSTKITPAKKDGITAMNKTTVDIIAIKLKGMYICYQEQGIK
jgi:hypothetical protein